MSLFPPGPGPSNKAHLTGEGVAAAQSPPPQRSIMKGEQLSQLTCKRYKQCTFSCRMCCYGTTNLTNFFILPTSYIGYTTVRFHLYSDINTPQLCADIKTSRKPFASNLLIPSRITVAGVGVVFDFRLPDRRLWEWQLAGLLSGRRGHSAELTRSMSLRVLELYIMLAYIYA